LSLDTLSYRKTIGLFATGVAVVAAESQGTVHGMTANAVASLSLDPILLLVCVAKKARMARTLELAHRFTVNILAEDQETASRHYAGQPTSDPDRIPRFVDWEGSPRLEGSLASLCCERHDWIDGGDHWIVVGKVVAVHHDDSKTSPLVYFQGGYGKFIKNPI
jgi:flavin reductase (DIM6/NTAB) family NADH-FMN oxidoreductase RutF